MAGKVLMRPNINETGARTSMFSPITRFLKKQSPC